MSHLPLVIYALVDPETDRVMYVGSTIYPKIRLSQFMSNPPSKGTLCWVESLRRRNLRATMRILESLTNHKRSYIRENHWIKTMRKRGEPVLNVVKAAPFNHCRKPYGGRYARRDVDPVRQAMADAKEVEIAAVRTARARAKDVEVKTEEPPNRLFYTEIHL